jgi:propionate CoA-transferase
VPVGKVVSADDAIALIRDADVVASSGYGGHGVPEHLLSALGRRFVETGTPRHLTVVWAGGQGDGKDRGLNHLAHEGLIARAIGGHFGLSPALERLAVDGRIEAYNLPEGVIVQLYRDIGAGKPGTLSRVGLGTFVDPRRQGGRMNDRTREPLVEVCHVGGQESLFFKATPIHVAFVRGTTADADGNVTMEHEALALEALSLAVAARNSGGVVLCQVERLAERGSLPSRQVRLPAALVDCVVVAPPSQHTQTYATVYNPAFAGEIRVPAEALAVLPLDERKVIARRAALELRPGDLVNLGIGTPAVVASVAAEERIAELITLTVDPGVIGGIPAGGLDFGAAVNAQAIIDHAIHFDLIDGGGIDVAVLGMGECDGAGNVNVSRYAGRLPGCGGFIDIAHRSRRVIFTGPFTAGGLVARLDNGRLAIEREGSFPKFVPALAHITFAASVASAEERDILYVTERCVFRLTAAGLELTEVAPGIDIARDILDRLPFRPVVDAPRVMDPAMFLPEAMGLRERLLEMHLDERVRYDPSTNTLFLNFAGLRVRTASDVRRIVEVVDATLAPVGRRVNAIVNYESFAADPEVLDVYADAVKYVEERYYLKVSRYSTSAFLRLRLGQELGKRRVDARVYESHQQARRHLME